MPDSRVAFLLFFLAFLARGLACTGSALFGTDAATYLQMADWMAEGRIREALSTTYHPLLSMLVAVVRFFAPSTPAAGYWVSVSLGAAATIPLFQMVRAVFGRPAGVVASLLYAFGPAIVHIQSDVMTEAPYTFFAFLSMWLTWRMMESPSAGGAPLLGLSAAGAFLARPEGLLAIVLAVGWPLVETARVRTHLLRRLGSLALTAIIILVLVSPYLFFVKSLRGHWAVSARPSALSAEQSLGLGEPPPGAAQEDQGGELYRTYLESVFALSLYGLLLPFYALGLTRLRLIGLRGGLYYFSYPVGMLGGTLFALRSHNFMSERYLMAGMSLLGAVAASGIVAVAGRLAGRREASSAGWIPGAVLIFLVAVLPGATCLALRRQKCLGYPAAARWILSQGQRPGRLYTPISQIAYLCNSLPVPPLASPGALPEGAPRPVLGYVVYSEKDSDWKTVQLARLRLRHAVGPAVEIEEPRGSWRIYIHPIW